MDVTASREPMTKIAESEAELRSFVEGLDGIPWRQVFDPRTGVERYTYIGPQVLDIIGYTPDELIAEQRHFTRMVHPEDREITRKMTRRSKTTGLWSGTFRVIARDGSIHHFRGIARRTITEDGLHVWNGVTFDETDQGLRTEDEAPGRAREGTDAASRAAPPSRPPAGGSPAGR
jgi:two-component system, sensor histidine kinase and response regulator